MLLSLCNCYQKDTCAYGWQTNRNFQFFMVTPLRIIHFDVRIDLQKFQRRK